MRNPKNMGIIQIDVTNVCPHTCSNCTRFCGHHKKPFFMDMETFKQAVDSLDGFDGVVGVIGGEPTVHPRFEEIAEYLHDRRTPGVVIKNSRYPIRDMQWHIVRHLGGTWGGATAWRRALVFDQRWLLPAL
ncbi:MAG: radical SAM protein [Synergistaceae bacterium]|jgi:MoaA/NifB/PqqE/SkfB family radical SAM enzyme|nr:radical SAM protein [Synergistaceae bacterium]